MARFMAFHTMPGMTRGQFTEALKSVRQWRPNPRTTVIKVYCNLEAGRMVSECEAPTQEEFEAWLKERGWSWDVIHRVDLIAQTGNVWEV